ncbi:FAD-dependent monooxygenase [uncultured Nocardioides sp.]|uniref:FAD-dependent monooxygenase n=1 Tax=uncultured Nocardioides sp. TaxID=198441 RepID=UPI0026184A68|nr:FAD-dependent monooxygenase [uncultured Nocardioides sp.]
MSRRVLVTGGSIAGAASAFWLARVGFAVTVLESAPAFRPGGQNIDVRATGREALRRMGLEGAVRARNTGEVGTRFVDGDGTVVSEFGVDTAEGSEGPTAELEILRGALAQVVMDACEDSVAWRYGDRVTAVTQRDGGGVEVSYETGDDETYDLLVVAEGVGSRTRELVFGGEAQERTLGMYSAYGTIPRTPGDDDFWNVFHAPGSRQAALRPDDEGTIRANLNFLADSPVLDGLDDEQTRAALRERFADAGWQVPRILDGFDAADDLYVDWLRQVRVPTWHRGSVVLTGDAAWCVTPIGGGGASLAIAGAYVLAAYLSAADGTPAGDEAAFTAYDAWMRPLVEDAQDLPRGVPRLAAPKTALGVGALRLATKVAASKPVKTVAQKVTGGPQSTRQLPDLVEA